MDTFLLTLSNDFNKILENELCYDLIITIGKEPVIDTFRVHSAILCARCPYFQVALSNNWIKKDDDKFIFAKPNIFPKTFEVILRYLYGGTINLDRQGSSDLILLLEASDELCLNELCEYIQDCIITKHDLYKNVLKYHSRWFKFYPRAPARVKPIDSTIVTYKDAAILASWIDGKDKVSKDTKPMMYDYHDNPYNFKLLYRGSRDGFTYGALKKHCYYKGPTIVVAKIKGKQELIGGYNPMYWTTSELPYSSSRTKNGFIFSAKRNDDNFQEEATVARIKYDYSHFTAYRGYPYLSFGFNNLSFHGRECHVRFSHSLCFFPRIKVPDNYLLDEFEVFAVIPKS
ncbi:15438_t:CDS:2, partial [Funneliformis mosseae]